MLGLWRVVHQQNEKKRIPEKSYHLIQLMNIFYNLFVGETIATGTVMVELDQISCKRHKDSCTSRLRRLLRYDFIHHQNTYVEHSDSTYKCISTYSTVVYACIYTYLYVDTYTSVRYVTFFPPLQIFSSRKTFMASQPYHPSNETRV